jgi:hypothetical protein
VALARTFADSALVKAVIKTARVACPHEPKYDENYCFSMVDLYFTNVLTLNVGRMTEGSLVMKGVHLLERFGWGRGGELRSFNRDHITLQTGASADPATVQKFCDADRMLLTFQGTKHGKGMQQQSQRITIARLRSWVVGAKQHQALDLFAVLDELELRYCDREIGDRENSRNAKKYASEQQRFGNGFFLSLKPETASGKHYYLSSDRIRNYGQMALQKAGVPRKYTGHATRHAAISLLLDAGVPETRVARQARHSKQVAAKVYRHPSDEDHMKRAQKLWADVPKVTPQELLACALTPWSQSPTEPTKRARKRAPAVQQSASLGGVAVSS